MNNCEISALPILDEATGLPFYDITAALPNQLVTNIGKSITYKPEMTVVAEIITEKKSILLRIFQQLL